MREAEKLVSEFQHRAAYAHKRYRDFMEENNHRMAIIWLELSRQHAEVARTALIDLVNYTSWALPQMRMVIAVAGLQEQADEEGWEA